MSSDVDHLFTLLNLPLLNFRKEKDNNIENAIIDELKQNPQSAAKHYYFHDHGCTHCLYPLQQAFRLRANINLVEAIYDCHPTAIEVRHEFSEYTALHFALVHKVPSDVALFVLKKLPNAVRETDCDGYLPLHCACSSGFSVDVVSSILDLLPDAVRERSTFGELPLHCACDGNAPPEVMALLLSSWPASAREKAFRFQTPLHCAVEKSNISIENVCLLLDHYPEALREKTESQRTPLHYACFNNAPLKVVLMLLEPFPEAVLKNDESGMTPLDLCEKFCSSKEVQKVLSSVFHLYGIGMNNESAQDISNFFIEIGWWNGVMLILDQYPSFYDCLKMGTNVLPHFLSAIQRHCMMKTVWHVICNEQDILAGV